MRTEEMQMFSKYCNVQNSEAKLLCCVLTFKVCFVLFVRKLRKRHRQTNIVKMSSKSAGVYLHTTKDINITTNPMRSGSCEYLRQDSDDLFESDNEDELWSAKPRAPNV